MFKKKEKKGLYFLIISMFVLLFVMNNNVYAEETFDIQENTIYTVQSYEEEGDEEEDDEEEDDEEEDDEEEDDEEEDEEDDEYDEYNDTDMDTISKVSVRPSAYYYISAYSLVSDFFEAHTLNATQASVFNEKYINAETYAECNSNTEEYGKYSAFEKNSDYKYIFSEGQKYLYTITVRANKGYCFDNDTKVYLNGEACDFTLLTNKRIVINVATTDNPIIPDECDHSYAYGEVPKCASQTIGTCNKCGATRVKELPNHKDHKYEETDRVEATCDTMGSITYQCKYCEGTYKVDIPAIGHKWNTEIEAATTSDYGSIKYECDNEDCDAVRTTYIAPASNVYLSRTSFTYSGGYIYPSVIVKDSSKRTISSDNYDVKYDQNFYPGTGHVFIYFKNKYDDTVHLKFKINKVSQSIRSRVSSKTYKKSALKKTAQSFSIGASAKTRLTYKSSKTKYIKVSKSGKVTVKKGTPKGTYKITVTAVANGIYNKKTKVITIKVK